MRDGALEDTKRRVYVMALSSTKSVLALMINFYFMQNRFDLKGKSSIGHDFSFSLTAAASINATSLRVCVRV